MSLQYLPIFLKRSLVSPILLLSSISLYCSLKKAFFSFLAGLWNSLQLSISFPFSFAFLFFLFVRPPQTTILPSCVSFSWGWFRSPPPVQYYEPLSIVFQALCLPDLIPWIYLSPPLYNHKWFDLGHTLEVFPTFFNLSLKFAIRSWWYEPQSLPGLVWLYRASPSLTAKNITWFQYWPSGDINV